MSKHPRTNKTPEVRSDRDYDCNKYLNAKTYTNQTVERMTNPVIKRPTLLPTQFALIEVKRDRNDVSYSLATFDLNNSPPFAALSYVWGKEIAAKPFVCSIDAGGRDYGTPESTSLAISIPQNLESILTELSQLFNHGQTYLGHNYIWADSICIDQGNQHEKEQQIPNMKTIYQSATEVLICVGSTQDDSAEAMAVIATVAATLDRQDSYSQYSRQTLSWHITHNQVQALATILREERTTFESNSNFLHLGLPELGHPLWPSLARFYSRKWFNRLWTFQEAVLANKATLCCGDRFVSWLDVLNVGLRLSSSQLMYVSLNDLQTPTLRSSNPTLPIARICDFSQESSENVAFLTYLRASRMREVEKVHDHVFAILGLANDRVRSEITVSYDLSPFDVFSMLSRSIMRHHGLGSILGQVRSEYRAAELPSWCPEFRYPPEMTAFPTSECRSVTIPRQVVFDVLDPQRIMLGGAQIDAVDEIVNNFQWQWHGASPLVYGLNGDAMRIYKWLEACRGLIQRYHPSSEKVIDELLTSAVLAAVSSRSDPVVPYPPRAIEGLRAVRRRMQQLAQGSSKNDVEPLSDESGRLMGPVFALLGRLWRGSNFFATKSGQFGIASRLVAVNDKVVALFGECQLFVLRAVGKETHQYVSQCHVTELSDGQIFTREDLIAKYEMFILV